MSRQDEVGSAAESCPHPTMAQTPLLIFLLCCECQVSFGKFCHEVLCCTESSRYQLPDLPGPVPVTCLIMAESLRHDASARTLNHGPVLTTCENENELCFPFMEKL